MRPDEDNIQTLAREVMNEARAEAEKLMVDARQRGEAILAQAREKAAAEREAILAQAGRDADRIRGQAAATAQLQSRTRLLESREALLQDAFDSVRAQLAAVEHWSDYDQVARGLLREALEHLGAGKAVLRCDAATAKVLPQKARDEICAEAKVELAMGPVLERGLGVVVQTEDGHRQFDNTLETRLIRLQESLRAPVYHLLMGESL
jgi:vacuolar-type H+-ATPase subunit E/Vma4